MESEERILLKYEVKLKYDENSKQSQCGMTLQNTLCRFTEGKLWMLRQNVCTQEKSGREHNLQSFPNQFESILNYQH